MRLDRSLTVNLVGPLRRGLRCFGASNSPSVSWSLPILMYHSVSDEAENNVPPYYRVATPPEVFRQHLESLKAAGYRGVDIKTGMAALTLRTAESKLAVITFDDGFRNLYTDACPLLREFGFTATVYLPTASIGDQRRSFKSRECLTWSEVIELQKSGIHFGSHTVTHPRLVELNWTSIKEELFASKAQIENRLGIVTDAFAYPYAYPDMEKTFVSGLSQLLLEAGYTSCVTTRVGRVFPGDDLLRLRRLPANSGDDAPFFRAKLEGDYDWIAFAQASTKRIKKTVFRQGRNAPIAGNVDQASLFSGPHYGVRGK